ncbi:unnamed protein product [Blepharisma stoltei]|uniref:Tetratricopeptide repeat protein 29 n=1 Tax=Blepharisma stoltei TaxID=1481888 RepID=A0AAU9IV99_9CILI|nr:unnamed protein product [Blepharisma stoltei]
MSIDLKRNRSTRIIDSPSRSKIVKLADSRPMTSSSNSKKFEFIVTPEVYHTASTIHKTPGRHSKNAALLLNSASSKKFELTKAESLAHLQEQNRVPTPLNLSMEKKMPRKSRASSNTPSKNKPKQVPISKAEGEMILFKEIFVQPKEEKLMKLKTILASQQFDDLLLDKKNKNFLSPKSTVKSINKIENEVAQVRGDKCFFNHQIQVQPPEGLNATVAAPLTPGGGWAPSIPAGNDALQNTSLKDLVLRAKAGVQAGDVQKEAHMSFCLGAMNEENQNYKESARFYKRFFFCARLLDDPVGAALALNRLGVVYYNMNKLEKSIQFHMKHCEFSDKENKFAAYYNLGITSRLVGKYGESVQYFTKALNWANKRGDYESQCISLGQLGMSFLSLGEDLNAKQNLEACIQFATRIRNPKIQLDTLLALGFLTSKLEDWELSSEYFHSAIKPARLLGENEVADKCSCNVGIVDANRCFFAKQKEILKICSNK